MTPAIGHPAIPAMDAIWDIVSKGSARNARPVHVMVTIPNDVKAAHGFRADHSKRARMDHVSSKRMSHATQVLAAKISRIDAQIKILMRLAQSDGHAGMGIVQNREVKKTPCSGNCVQQTPIVLVVSAFLRFRHPERCLFQAWVSKMSISFRCL